MKRRIAAAVITLLLFSCLALLGAYNVHQIFSRQLQLSWSLWRCIAAVFGVPEVRRWFLLLECCALLSVIWMIYSRQHIKYKSNTVQICPGIETPVVDGQGQYGTARWLSDQELTIVFTVVTVDTNAALLRQLRQSGADDLKEEGTT